ncbi:MAG: hypothetical protein KHX35_06180 [Sutterella wadsworthensis]|nr:hypothetical protein [Sutterella wadsworthensis]
MTEVRSNPPKPIDTPENMHRGIALVLLPGYGPKDFNGDQPYAKGLIDSSHVDRGTVVQTVLAWLNKSGLDVKRQASAFRLVVWPEKWVESNLRGPQMVSALVEQSSAFVKEMNETQPALLVLVSCYLHDALLNPEVVKALKPALGKPLMPPTRLCSTRLRAQVQRWEKALVVSLPIPSQRTTSAFSEALALGLKPWLNQNERK